MLASSIQSLILLQILDTSHGLEIIMDLILQLHNNCGQITLKRWSTPREYSSTDNFNGIVR